MHPMTNLVMDRRTALWNAVIPKRAVRVQIGETHVRYLHPTKGWKTVAKSRVGL